MILINILIIFTSDRYLNVTKNYIFGRHSIQLPRGASSVTLICNSCTL
jgi:hypothetical protein